jgi:serine/threonine protein kinase
VLATAVLERAEMVHGDLSPNNIVIDAGAPPGGPALCLIDFDAFVAPAAGADQAVEVAEGGTYGTEGYCPPELGSRAGAGDGSVAPYSDRYGRDMLILELLFMDSALSPDDPPAKWDRERLLRRHAAWQASCDPARWQALNHLEIPGVFSLSECGRPTSAHLAASLGLELPESPVIWADAPISSSPSALRGLRAVPAQVQRRRSPRRAAPRVREQSRQAAPAQRQPLSRWQVPAQVVTRSFRRTRKPALPKDDPAAVLLVILFFALFWLLLLSPLFFCAD